MKKLLALLLCSALCLSLIACGAKTSSTTENANSSAAETAASSATENTATSSETKTKTGEVPTLEQLFDKSLGYSNSGIGYCENQLEVIMHNQDRTAFYVLDATLSDEDIAAHEALDFFDDNYWDNLDAWICSLGNKITVVDISDKMPSPEELNKLVGKTIAELEQMGYEQTGMDEDPNGNFVVIYTIDKWDIAISLGEAYQDMMSFVDVEDHDSLVVASATFFEFRNYFSD